MEDKKAEKTPVIIIGGSLVGLSAALFLAAQKAPFILIEKHTASSKHPRAMGYPERTMEIYTAFGIADQITQTDGNFDLRRATIESLSGKWISESSWTPKGKLAEDHNDIQQSPCTGAAIPQDKLEPILRNKAIELGADLRLGAELLHFEQTEDEVNITVKERSNGKTYHITGEYLIAADGAKSSIRESLNIERTGIGKLQVMRSVLFTAPLDEYLQTGITQFEIEQPDLKAFLTTYQDDRWVLMFKDDIERNEEALLKDIRKTIGKEDIPINIITTGRWDLEALISNRYSKGRTFLAGDAAHTLPPTRGGFGANTGIQDAHNLAWKLKAVLVGASRPSLLDTYEEERKPMAQVRYDQMFARRDYSQYLSKDAQEEITIYSDVSMELGQVYRSKGIRNQDANVPDAMPPNQWEGQPGTRAPHLWIQKDKQKISTLDLFQHGWVLLTTHKTWKEAAHTIDNQIDLSAYLSEIDFYAESPQDFTNLYGIGKNGAVLVRPDGFIAWKTDKLASNAEKTLNRVMKQTAFLNE